MSTRGLIEATQCQIGYASIQRYHEVNQLYIPHLLGILSFLMSIPAQVDDGMEWKRQMWMGCKPSRP